MQIFFLWKKNVDKGSENKTLFFKKKDDSGSIPSTQYPAFHYPAIFTQKTVSPVRRTSFSSEKSRD